MGKVDSIQKWYRRQDRILRDLNRPRLAVRLVGTALLALLGLAGCATVNGIAKDTGKLMNSIEKMTEDNNGQQRPNQIRDDYYDSSRSPVRSEWDRENQARRERVW